MADVKELVEKITKAISYQFKKVEGLKGPSPGLTISIIPTGDYYASIVKYEGALENKQVVAKATGQSLEEVLVSVSNQFLNSILVDKNPLDELNGLVNQNDDLDIQGSILKNLRPDYPY